MKCILIRALLICALLPLASASAARIERIVSLAPNLTELAFAAGAGAHVVGTAEYSDYPSEARRIPRIGDAFRFDIERIVALEPQLVLAWTTGTPPATIERLGSLGLNVREFRLQRLADIPRVVRELGALAGSESEAERAASAFEASMAELASRYGSKEPLRVFLQVNSRPLYTVNKRQLMSEVLELCGGRNVFGDLNQLAPQVSLEAVIARNPDVIVVTDDGEPHALDEWRKWPQLEAVRAGNLFQLPASDLAQASTRLADGAAMLCRVLETARARKIERM
jgi:iron complex transport system substrate-binding protein